MSGLIPSTLGQSSRGLVTNYTSILHEGAGSVQACHDRIKLPGSLSICLDSTGRTHSVVMSINFFDKAANRVGPAKWFEVWSDTIAARKQSDAIYGDGQVEAAAIGLDVSVAIMGRKSSAAYAIYWDDDAPRPCRHGCKIWKVGETNGRPKVIEVPTSGGQRTVHTPYGTLRCDRQTASRVHTVGGYSNQGMLEYLN